MPKPKPRRSAPSRPAKRTSAPKPVKAKAAPKPVKPQAKKPAILEKKPAARPVGTSAKPTGKKTATVAAKPPAMGSVRHVKSAVVAAAKPKAKKAVPAEPARTTPAQTGPAAHEQAVVAFERGLQALHQRQFARAADLLSSVVSNFPDEKEMHERARVYLSICARQAAGANHAPKSFEERVNAATVAINRGAYDEALGLLTKLAGDHGSSDHVHYMLSVVYAVTGHVDHALKHLQQSVELNHENRYLANQDADLESLRQLPGFAAAIDIAALKPKAAASISKRR
jgi:Tfp pilus assembly protein PilF